MKLKQKRLYSFFLAVFFLGTHSLSYGVPSVAESFPGGESPFAEDFSDQNYFPKLRGLLTGAQKTLDIAAENFTLSDLPNDPVAHLIEDIIRSRKKGVRVRIFLNTFSEIPENTPLFLREDTLYRLRREGVEIHFVNPDYHLRDRLVIVDEQMVLEGGIPWNKTDLEKGLGSAVLVHSPELAAKKRVRLEFLPLWDVEQQRTDRIEGSVPVPFFLLREIKYFPSMVSHDDGDAMKIYLALIRNFFQVQDVHLKASFEDLGREIPAANYYEKGTVQFQVLKTLERLASEYGLIEIKEKAVDYFQVRMILPSQNEPVIRVPIALFQENYVKELSPAALFSYLVILYRAQVSGEAPVWLGSERNVEQDFPVTSDTFRGGVVELREKNLVEIYPFKLQEGYKTLNSLEYRYLINPVTTMSQRLEIWSRLRDQYGEDAFKKAREMAGYLGEPEDPKVITVYLDLMKHFKVEDIFTFTERLSQLAPESTPQRLTYLRTLLEHETQKGVQLAV